MYLKRLKTLIVLIAVAQVALAVRIGYLQVVQGDHYRSRAEALLQHTELVPTKRGSIHDRHGLVLAMDTGCFDLCLDYRLMTESQRWIRREVQKIRRTESVARDRAREIFDRRVENTWRLVERVTGKGRDELKRTVVARIVRRVETIRGRVGMDIREQRQAHPIVRGLAKRLDTSELADTVGVSSPPSSTRVYPQGHAACHVIGTMGEVSAEEQDRLNVPADGDNWLHAVRRNYLPGDTIGKSGVEKLCEAVLRGRRGYRRYRRVRALSAEGAFTPGQDVRLTIDIELQKRVAELVRRTGRNGCLVMLSVPAGEILAMVSVPTFDLSRWRRDYNDLVRDVVNQPFKHRAVGELYPPGSTMKPLAAVGALADKRITLNTTFTCTGSMFASHPHRFRCWIHRKGGHGPLSVRDALMQSCNVFFYHVGELLGVQGMSFWSRQFGYSQKPGTGLGEEVAGVVPSQGTRGEARMLAIGQSGLSVTPLHVANAMATLARNGEFRSPGIVLGPASPPQNRRTLPGGTEVYAAVRRGMDKVVNDPKSMTAYKYFHGRGVAELGFALCGKTGTAQTSVRRVDTTGDGQADVTLSGNMVWFAGFAPRTDPKVAFAVMLEYVPDADGGGAKNCAPIAREALRIWHQMGYLEPGRKDAEPR